MKRERERGRRGRKASGDTKVVGNVCFMNGTALSNDNIVRYIVQNVTEHLQEDEKDSFMLAYALIALIACLVISFAFHCEE